MLTALGFLTKFIPFKVQIYILAAGILVAAFIGVYWSGGHNAVIKVEAKRDQKRLKSLLDKEEIEDENENKTDSELAAGITSSKRLR